MSNWIFILKLLAANVETGEITWIEAYHVENLTFSVCIENVVETTNILSTGLIEHEVYCEKMPNVEVVEEKDENVKQ